MQTLADNSQQYNEIVQQRDKLGRNTKKYYACVQMLKINKLERKLILEQQEMNIRADKYQAWLEGCKRSQHSKQQIIDALQEDIDNLKL